MKHKGPFYPSLYAEQYYLDELAPQTLDKIKASPEWEQSLKNEVQGLENQNKDFFRDYPADKMLAKIKADAKKDPLVKTKILTFPLYKGLAVAAALAVLVLFPMLFMNRFKSGSREEGIRIKGASPALSIFLKQGKRAVRLESNSIAQEGDLIQIQYNSAGYPYGCIFSIDGNAVVTRHLPTGSEVSAELEKGLRTLNFSYELDDAPYFERFFFAVSEKPFVIDPVIKAFSRMSAVQPGKKDPALKDVEVYTFILKKGERNE